MSRSPSALRIGEFHFDPDSHTLIRGDRAQRLPARLGALLLRLAAEPGRVIRRETLLDEVWSRREVNDEVLSRAIADLRHALGDEARAPRYIETLPKLGYRFLAEVGAAVAPPEPAASDRTDPAADAFERVVPHPRAFRGRPVLRLTLLAVGVLGALGTWAWRSSRIPADPLTPANLARARPFTTEPGRELHPHFAPDGQWVVYAHATDGAPAGLRLRAVDGTSEQVLEQSDRHQQYCGRISPDGRTLAWLRVDERGCRLMIRPLLGGSPRQLAACGDGANATCPDWYPDGTGLVMGGIDAGERGLRRIAFPGGESRRLPSAPPDAQWDIAPRVAPDGRSIAFWRADAWGRTPWRLDLIHGQAHALGREASLGFGLAFAPDGRLLAADDRLGQRALLQIDPPRSPRLLGGADARHPDVARNGAIVYEVARYDANLWRIDLRDSGAVPVRLTASPRYDSQPALAPDAHRIAFVSNRDGREAIFLMQADGRDERKLPLDPSLRWTSPAWSSDGQSLLVLRYDADVTQACIWSLEAGRLDCPDTWRPSWHGAFAFGPGQVGLVDIDASVPRLWLARGEAAPAPTELRGVDRCRASPRWLVCHRRGRSGLWLQPRDRPEQGRELLPELSAASPGNWALVDAAIYAVLPAAEDRAAGIHRLDLDDGRLTWLRAEQPDALGDVLAVAPDESFLVLARNDGLETDLMLVPPPQR